METLISQVNAPTAVSAIEVCIAAQRSTFLWGSPGIGKSDLQRSVAAHLGGVKPSEGKSLGRSRWEFGKCLLIDVRASQWDAVDTRGIPYLDENKLTAWGVPAVFPTEAEAAQYDVVIIFLDELNTAAPSVQAALYQLILDRSLGDYVLPANVVVNAAGNKETDRAVAHRMSSALADRFFHFELTVDNEAWEQWALSADLAIECIAYNRWRPGHLHAWDPKSPSKSQATPRGWEFVSDILKVTREQGTPALVENALICAKLGETVGAEFVGFLRIFRNLPDPAAVIMAPDTAEVSDDPSVNAALCGALSERVSEDNIGNILIYAERLSASRDAGPEFMTLLVRSCAVKGGTKVQQTRAFIEWASNNPDVYI